MPTIQELRDQRANAWAQAQDYLDRSKGDDGLTAEDETAWQRALDEVDTLVGSVQFDDSAKRDLASVYAVAAASVRESDASLAADLTQRALRQLAECLAEGLYDRAAIEAESDFDTLRADPGYLHLFEEPAP